MTKLRIRGGDKQEKIEKLFSSDYHIFKDDILYAIARNLNSRNKKYDEYTDRRKIVEDINKVYSGIKDININDIKDLLLNDANFTEDNIDKILNELSQSGGYKKIKKIIKKY